MKAQITGVASLISSSEFNLTKYLSMVSNFSISLQKGTLSACESQTVVKTNVQAIKSERSDLDFALFWKYLGWRSEIDVYFNA